MSKSPAHPTTALNAPLSVLIVDEHPATAEAIARAMKSSGELVLSASSLDEARRLTVEQTPDVVVMGWEGKAGVELMQELRDARRPPEIIVHTESSASRTAVWAASHQIEEVFEKPAAPAVLLDWARRLLRRKRGEPESVTLQRSQVGLGRLLGHAPPLVALHEQVLKVAEFPLMSVLVCGEIGTGKELVARAIHELTCPDAPFVSLNCGAILESHFESELFGDNARALSGEGGRRSGLLDEAKDGTFFLDEVEQLPVSMQPKLLKVLETRVFRPVGDGREQPLKARIIAATNRTLPRAKESLRPDLYYCLAGFALGVPSLRDRPQDILLLANAFLREFCRFHGRPMMRIAEDAAQLLHDYRWPENVRELRGVIENAAVSAQTGVVRRANIEAALGARGARVSTGREPDTSARDVTPGPVSIELPRSPGSETEAGWGQVSDASEVERASELEPRISPPPSSGLSLVGKGGAFSSLPALEQHVISDIYHACRGNLSMAARTLGIPRSTLRDRLKKYGIAPASSRKKEALR